MGINLDAVEFVIGTSDQYLPRCDNEPLDYVFLDGKHAFPWPMIDWFYTADRLHKGGLLLLDDINFRSVGVLDDFLTKDPHWRRERSPDGPTAVFRKTEPDVLDVAWHMQPWNMLPPEPWTLRRRLSALKRKILRIKSA